MRSLGRRRHSLIRNNQRGRQRSIALLLAVAFVAFACVERVALSRPPAAEFLLAAGDSTYWIRSNADGIRVRSAPILLTQADGKLYEVFIADDVRDFAQASFAIARAWSRDITRDDSVLVFDEGSVAREAADWLKKHPGATPVDPEDLDPDAEPPTVVSDDIEVIDVHGPWLTIGHSLDIDVSGRPDHRHRRTTALVDVRTGTRGTLAELFGVADAARIGARARSAFAAVKDSVQQSSDERSEAARKALASFAFDSSSFGLTDVGGAPAVAFLVPGTGEQGDPLVLHLRPETATRPNWWNSVEETLPKWNADSSVLSWRRAAYDVFATPIADGELLNIELVDRDSSRNNTSASRRWPIATVPSPTYQLIPLDKAILDSVTRAALARAFDQSSVLNGRVQRASFEPKALGQYWLRMVSWRNSATTDHERRSCCGRTRRLCRTPRSGISTLHRVPARPDAGHPDSGHRCRLASL